MEMSKIGQKREKKEGAKKTLYKIKVGWRTVGVRRGRVADFKSKAVWITRPYLNASVLCFEASRKWFLKAAISFAEAHSIRSRNVNKACVSLLLSQGHLYALCQGVENGALKGVVSSKNKPTENQLFLNFLHDPNALWYSS